MAGQLNIKLLVASVHNLRVLLIFFDLILLVSLILAICWCWDPFEKMLFSRKKFLVHVVISILQAFNCLFIEIFVHDLYFFSLYFKAKTQRNKGMSDFDSGNSVTFVLLDINLYETKSEK